jgi:hypothetical protein
MVRNIRWNILSMAVAIITVLTTGAGTFIVAEEKREVPDHTGFETCRPCHAEKSAMWEASGHSRAISQVAINDKAATECSGCHSSRQIVKTGSVAIESVHKVSCLACHKKQKGEYDHRLVMDHEKLCKTCHAQGSVFLGLGAKGIEDSRNFHSGVPCVSCHMSEGNHKMKVIRPDDPTVTAQRLDTCTTCHKDNNREARVRQIQEWQSTYDENMAPLKADIKFIEAALEKKPGILKTPLKLKFDDVKANLAILEKDGSRGFHNFVFSLEITSMAATDLKAITAAIK